MNENLLKERFLQIRNTNPHWDQPIQLIQDWLLSSEPIQKHRINPYTIVKSTELPLRTIIGIFLYGVKEQLFQLNWDIHCPHCNMITNEYNSLNNLHGTSYCKMCSTEFLADFSERVEVTFSMHPDIEIINLPPFCAPPKYLKVYAELALTQGETKSVDLELPSGTYRYFCPITLSKGVLYLDGNSKEEIQNLSLNQLGNSNFDHPFYRLKPGKIHLTITNESVPISGLFITEENLDNKIPVKELDLYLSGFTLTHIPEFKELFGEETLSKRERMTISSVTILFTDITGSTKMYEELGDIKAYNLVRDHFEILGESVVEAGGVVIKTIGDAVMASFQNSIGALEAVFLFTEKFKKYNDPKQTREHINLKIGIHTGPAILVNLNNQIDYFGNTINKAARVQSFAVNNSICVSEEIFNNHSTKKFLQGKGIKKVNRKFRELKGLKGNHPLYYISLSGR